MCFNLSVVTEESVAVVEEVGSSQGESVTQIAGAGERELSTKNRDFALGKLERSDEEASLENLESSRVKSACAAAILGVQPTVVCRDFIKAGGKRPMPGECAAIAADEADEYANVVGSSTPMHGGADSERFTFSESGNHAYLQDSGRVPDTSGFPLFSFLISSSLCFSFLW